MRNLVTRNGVYYVRYIVPKDRWEDVGRATNARKQTRRDITKTLATKSHRDALRYRDAAVAKIIDETNKALIAAGLMPLHGDWTPSWGDTRQGIISDALSARKLVEQASDYREPVYLNDEPETGVVVSESSSDRDFGIEITMERIAARVDALAAQIGGQKGREIAQTTYQEAHGVVTGTSTPLSLLLDRWFTVLQGKVTNEQIDRHHRAFKRLGQHLAERHGAQVSDPEEYARSLPIEDIDRKVVGHFREWLDALPAFGPRVVASHLSTMITFWRWMRKNGYNFDNHWEGSTEGIKKEIAKASRERGSKRPYTENELVMLLSAARRRVEPEQAAKRTGKGSPWAAAIYDMLRLGLLTGCRQNELASLTVARVIHPEPSSIGQTGNATSTNAAVPLWRIAITPDVGKTEAAEREVPLHPLARSIIERRLSELPPGHLPTALLFPECKPGGRDKKSGHYLSKRYATFLKSVQGATNEVDFHSLRRNFATFFKQAEANGAPGCSDLVLDHLIGHRPASLASNTYAAKRFDWATYERAILGMVEKGMPEGVSELLK